MNFTTHSYRDLIVVIGSLVAASLTATSIQSSGALTTLNSLTTPTMFVGIETLTGGDATASLSVTVTLFQFPPDSHRRITLPNGTGVGQIKMFMTIAFAKGVAQTTDIFGTFANGDIKWTLANGGDSLQLVWTGAVWVAMSVVGATAA